MKFDAFSVADLTTFTACESIPRGIVPMSAKLREIWMALVFHEGIEMSQSLAQIYAHLIFSTKHRQPFLSDSVFRNQLHAYLAGICKNLQCPPIQIGGVADHVHVLCRLSKTTCTSDLVRDLKRDSTKWIHLERPTLFEFAWQAGFGAFSISPGHVSLLTEYIKNQDEHHRKESFQDELRRVCEKYSVDLDDRYAWD